MPSSSASESDPCARRKKEKKPKKEKDKKGKKEKKPKKEKKAKSEGSESSGHERKRQRREVEPNFEPSGLLAQASSTDDAPPRLRLGPATPARPREARSRSRDDPPPPGGGANPLDRMGEDAGEKGKGKGKGKGKDGEEPKEKEQPNFEASGLLAMEDNSKNGIALKFTMPSDSRRPDRKWRLYIFSKQNEAGKICHIHRLAGYLFGKDRRVADVPTDHPTCSKQHAVLHYRMHSASGEVRPYIMDLESTNGTHINGERIEPARYYELKEKDTLKFGLSSREFVLLHTGSDA